MRVISMFLRRSVCMVVLAIMAASWAACGALDGFVGIIDDGFCGDGFCEDFESEFFCPEDCQGGFSSCGDGFCDFFEDEFVCPEDCGNASPCGDGFCDFFEDEFTCFQDCFAPECFSDFECGDGDSCTFDECINGACQNTEDCECRFDGECDDGDPCTIDVCDFGTCLSDPVVCGFAQECEPATGACVSRVICLNTCIFAEDGECDDGGPGALTNICALGTDCIDCESRDIAGDGSPDDGCSDTCPFAGDGECDDGGPGALTGLCTLGTDCSDCGSRDGTDVPQSGGCSDTCLFAGDGECDDGGVGAAFDVCLLGTDCADCGPRSSSESLCSDTCEFALDGLCDDGGSGSFFDVCVFGTDCGDCGPRVDDGLASFCQSDQDCFDGNLCTLDTCQLGECVSELVICGFADVCEPATGACVPFQACLNTCPFAGDGECDDGGPDALTDICTLGTDCVDCGNRSLTDAGP